MRSIAITAFKPTSRINRHLGILLGFVLISSLCFAGFAYDTSKLSDLQSRVRTATYISVLAVLRNDNLSVADQEALAKNIVGIFTANPNNNTKITRDKEQLLVSSKIPYSPVIAQYFGMTSMLARSKSAGRLTMSALAINSELNRVLSNLKGSEYLPVLARLLLEFEQKKQSIQITQKIETDKQIKISSSQNPVQANSDRKADNSKMQPKPFAVTGLAIRQAITSDNNSGSVIDPIVKKSSDGAVQPANQKSKITFDGKAGSKFTDLLDGRKPSRNRRHKKTDLDVDQLLKNSKDYALETGSNSGFNLMKMLAENRNRPANIKKSTFSWSALFKYVSNSYSDGEAEGKGKTGKQFAAPSSSVYIEFSLLVIVLSNLVLWSMTFLKYRMNKRLSREEAIHNRIHELTFS